MRRGDQEVSVFGGGEVETGELARGIGNFSHPWEVAGIFFPGSSVNGDQPPHLGTGDT